MGQFSKVLLAIDKVHTVLQRALDCRLGLGELNPVMDPTVPLFVFRVSVANISTFFPDLQIGSSSCLIPFSKSLNTFFTFILDTIRVLSTLH